MRRLAVTLSILALVACGETETGPAGESQAPPGVSAIGDEAAIFSKMQIERTELL